MNKTPILTKKINNLDYAPGIATYGTVGRDGVIGDNGNCIYYTSFNLISGEDLPSFKDCIRNQALPVTNGANISRAYQNGDYFFDKFGNILELYNIEDLKNHPNLGNNYLRYFKLVGKISSDDAANRIFSTTEQSARISLNPLYAGLDINSAESELNDPTTETYPLRVISNNLNGDNIELLSATAFHNYNKMPDFKIYYDTVRNVWHMNSDVPVVVDSELIINKEMNESDQVMDIDGYSPVIINDTPITVFYNYCRLIQWGKNGKTGIQLVNFPQFPEKIMKILKVKIVVQNSTTGSTEIYMIPANDKGWDETMRYSLPFDVNRIQQVSLIYNIEVYIDKFMVPTEYYDHSYNLADRAVLEKFQRANILVSIKPNSSIGLKNTQRYNLLQANFGTFSSYTSSGRPTFITQ